MILKDKKNLQTQDLKLQAGQRHEQDVAFYLRRAFKDHEQVFVFNDLKFEHNNETAQIDHLILHTFGFILIESKSITGEVKINKHEEFSRSYKGKWAGMPSPIKQVELQRNLLKELLRDNDSKLLDKLLGINKLQKGFGGRQWECLCAISSNAIIDRDTAPKPIAKKLIKAEFIADSVIKLMNLSTSKPNAFSFLKSDIRPWFNDKEIEQIAEFILEQNKSYGSEKKQLTPENSGPSAKPMEQKPQSVAAITTQEIKLKSEVTKKTVTSERQTDIQLCCKKCEDTNTLEPNWGKYGYYVKCNHCETNTPMKSKCPICLSTNTKVSKRKTKYSLNCQDCTNQTPLIYEKDALFEN